MVIAVDFDGTIVEHKYPAIGKEIPHAFESLKKIYELGHTLILWTFRSGKELDDAVLFCMKNGIEFFAINSNSPEEEFDLSQSRKIYADFYIDDRNIPELPDWPTIVEIIKASAR